MSDIEVPANLADMVRARARTRGDATVFEFEGRQTSFAELDILTSRVANALRAEASSRASASPISARTATSISNCCSGRSRPRW